MPATPAPSRTARTNGKDRTSPLRCTGCGVLFAPQLIVLYRLTLDHRQQIRFMPDPLCVPCWEAALDRDGQAMVEEEAACLS